MHTSRTLLIGVVLVVIVGAAIAVVAFMGKPSSHTPKAGQATEAPNEANAVTIQNYTFNPTPLRIKKGTTVTWTNKDIAKHNVVVDDGQPAGGPNGPLFGKGQTFSFTFNNAGTYSYHCSPHPYMKGAVEVTE